MLLPYLKANTNLALGFQKIEREQNTLLNALYQEKRERKNALALAQIRAERKEQKRLEEEAYRRLVTQDLANQKAKGLEIKRLALAKEQAEQAKVLEQVMVYAKMQEEIDLLKKKNEALQHTMQENLKEEAIRKEAEAIQKKSFENNRLLYAREQAKEKMEKVIQEKAKEEEKKQKEEAEKEAQQALALAKQAKIIAQTKARLAKIKSKEEQRKEVKRKKLAKERLAKKKLAQQKLAKKNKNKNKKKNKKTKKEHITARIDISQQKMKVFKGKKLLYVWKVSTARKGYKTATGNYKAQRIQKMHYSSLYHNSPMPYTIFYNGNYAIHGTRSVSKLGRPASHGCVRLHTKNAKKLYTLVKKNGKNNMSIKIVR